MVYPHQHEGILHKYLSKMILMSLFILNIFMLTILIATQKIKSVLAPPHTVSTRVSTLWKSLDYSLMTNLPPKLGAMTASADFVAHFSSQTCRHSQESTSSQYHETIFTFRGPLVLFSWQYDESKTENILLR